MVYIKVPQRYSPPGTKEGYDKPQDNLLVSAINTQMTTQPACECCNTDLFVARFWVLKGKIFDPQATNFIKTVTF